MQVELTAGIQLPLPQKSAVKGLEQWAKGWLSLAMSFCFT
jgi:hypothetical protein